MSADELTRLRAMLAVSARLAEFGRFAAQQNHELRQPLFAIKGLGQLLLEQETLELEEVREFARIIVEQAERLSRLVDDLRRLSRPAAESDQGPTDVAAIVRRVLALLRYRTDEQTRIEVAIAPGTAVGAAAPMLEQVILNLCANALDAVRGLATAAVFIRTAPDAPVNPETVAIEIADTGSGISEALRAELFRAFVTTKGEQGTGLGLAVSRELVEAAGGRLDLEEPGDDWPTPVHTVFRLSLPRARAE